MEEAAEVQKECAKCLTFGQHDREPGTNITNIERLNAEINDFFGTLEELSKHVEIDEVDPEAITAKVLKLRKWLEYSKELGILDK